MNRQPLEDAAWITINTPFSATKLESFILDLERLFRINSLLVIKRWKSQHRNLVSLEAFNLSNGQQMNCELMLARIDHGIRIEYRNLLKKSTLIQVEAASPHGSTLTITDIYSGYDETVRKQRLDEVDLSLKQWGADLQSFLRSWYHWSWLPPWRWYMVRIWQPMKPVARRVTHMIVVLTLAEMFLAMLLIVILIIEQ
jgi:hypothetical protein